MNPMRKAVHFLSACMLVFATGAALASGYAQTRYPIVMAHGFTGAGKMLGVLPYWYGIPEKLAVYGNSRVYTPTLSSVGGDEIRVLQLEAVVKQAMTETGTTRVNLIGHSQGATTVRLLAARHPEWVASLTTIGGPNHGSQLATIGWNIVQGVNSYAPWLVDAVTDVIEGLGWINGALNGQDLDQDALTALYATTIQGQMDFGRNVAPFGWNPDCNGARATSAAGSMKNADGVQVSYAFPIYSWMGKGAPLDLLRSGEDWFDPTAGSLGLSAAAIKYVFGEGNNDGVVGVCSARLGQVVSENYYWSHLDEVNQLMGLTPDADPRDVFVAHANRLKNIGL